MNCSSDRSLLIRNKDNNRQFPLLKGACFLIGMIGFVLFSNKTLSAAEHSVNTPASKSLVQPENASQPDSENTPASELNDKVSSESLSEQIDSTSNIDLAPDGTEVNPTEQNKIARSLQENPWVFLHAYKATYVISADGNKLGKASRKVTNKDGHWKLEVSTKLTKWLLTLRSKEYSKFKIHQDKMFTEEFYSKTKLSFRKDRLTHQVFDWSKKEESGKRGKKKWTLPLEQQVFDRANHLLKLRADLLSGASEYNYLVSYKGLREVYQYKKAAEEKVQTPFGEYQAVRMERVGGDESNFSIWLSPDLNYFPIKIAQMEQDKPEVTLTLTSLEFTSPLEVAKVSKEK